MSSATFLKHVFQSYPAYSVIRWLWWRRRQHYRCHL